MSKKEEQNEEATGVMEKPAKQLSKKEIREEEIKMCDREMQAVLAKYNCGLTAQITVTETGNFPRVFLRSLGLPEDDA